MAYKNTVEKVIAHIKKFYKIPSHNLQQLSHFFNTQFRIKVKPLINRHNIDNKVDIPYREILIMQDKFVFCPLDKASNNYGLICKKLYLLSLMEEMGIHYENFADAFTDNNVNGTYTKLNTYDKLPIILKHKLFHVKQNLNVLVDGDLPIIYALPKLHKSPIKFCFITGAYNSSVKPLALELCKIFSHLKQHFLNYTHNVANNCRTIKTYWAINNSNITEELNNIRNRNIKLYSADFTDMFTNIPHNIIISKMKDLITLCFKNSGKRFVATNGIKTFYTENIIDKYRCYNTTDLLYLIDYLLRNSYCMFANIIYKQNKGVPQGGNFSPLLADLTISMFEFEYSKSIRISENQLFIPFRYMDDLLIVHNYNENFIDHILTVVYKNTLSLKKTHISQHKCNYLDISLEVIDNVIETNLYNKTDYFNFKVNRFPHRDSEISINVKGNVIYTETLRIANHCSKFTHFCSKVKELYNILINNGFNKEFIIANILKCLYKNKQIFYKYNINDNDNNVLHIAKTLCNSP